MEKNSEKNSEKNFLDLNTYHKKYKAPENLERINKLKIPPNWVNVQISLDYTSKIQVIGFDNKNRKQYIYHPLWNIFSNNVKFNNIGKFDIKKLKKVLNKYI